MGRWWQQQCRQRHVGSALQLSGIPGSGWLRRQRRQPCHKWQQQARRPLKGMEGRCCTQATVDCACRTVAHNCLLPCTRRHLPGGYLQKGLGSASAASRFHGGATQPAGHTLRSFSSTLHLRWEARHTRAFVGLDSAVQMIHEQPPSCMPGQVQHSMAKDRPARQKGSEHLDHTTCILTLSKWN